jgi:hypothetical protein|tara:strand:- start:1109 stop:1324 length:216 start_codon:yes stop_codon:yes gene_type:complete
MRGDTTNTTDTAEYQQGRDDQGFSIVGFTKHNLIISILISVLNVAQAGIVSVWREKYAIYLRTKQDMSFVL